MSAIVTVGFVLIGALLAGYLLSYPVEWLYHRRADRIAAARAAVLVAEERRLAGAVEDQTDGAS